MALLRLSATRSISHFHLRTRTTLLRLSDINSRLSISTTRGRHFQTTAKPFANMCGSPSSAQIMGQWEAESDAMAINCLRPPPGYKYWDFTIYRSTYGDDAAWAELMSILHEAARRELERLGAGEKIESLDLLVHEDRNKFEAASKEMLRAYFKVCVQQSTFEEAADTSDARSGPSENTAPWTARYQFCLHVDEDSLYSIIDPRTSRSDSTVRRLATSTSSTGIGRCLTKRSSPCCETSTTARIRSMMGRSC